MCVWMYAFLFVFMNVYIVEAQFKYIYFVIRVLLWRQ